MGHIFIFLTVIFTVYGQLIIKQQVTGLTDVPSGIGAVPYFIEQILRKPLLLSGFISAFAASLCWMAALTRFDLNYAYPFMSLNFVLVAGLSYYFFNDEMSLVMVLGLALICGGVILVARG